MGPDVATGAHDLPPRWCEFAFTLTDVPDTAKFYSVTVANRGEISESHDELSGKNWVFALSLGS
jgi:hypothetical protein